MSYDSRLVKEGGNCKIERVISLANIDTFFKI
jgi:hypothetical protein